MSYHVLFGLPLLCVPSSRTHCAAKLVVFDLMVDVRSNGLPFARYYCLHLFLTILISHNHPFKKLLKYFISIFYQATHFFPLRLPRLFSVHIGLLIVGVTVTRSERWCPSFLLIVFLDFHSDWRRRSLSYWFVTKSQHWRSLSASTHVADTVGYWKFFNNNLSTKITTTVLLLLLLLPLLLLPPPPPPPLLLLQYYYYCYCRPHSVVGAGTVASRTTFVMFKSLFCVH